MNGARALVVFAVAGRRYALDLSAVERVLPMVAVSPLPRAPDIALGVVNIHGTIVAVVDIRRRFGLPPGATALRDRLLVARTARRVLALVVDAVVGVTEVSRGAITATEAVLPGIGYVAGVAALSDGVLFIHDIEAFLSLDEERRLCRALGENDG